METSNIMKAKVSIKGWVVIPAPLRRRHGLKPGTLVRFYEKGDKIILIPMNSDPIEECYGKLSGGTPLTEELLKERAKELNHEEAKLHTG